MKVLVAMSGGVDSSVAAALLAEQGHDVVGVTLKLWGGESDSGCCSVSDVEDARRVAAQLGIDHYVFNLGDDFTEAVVEPYVDAYAQGRTPNPCVECNRSIKFGRLSERARTLGFDAVATGHHARVAERDGRYELWRGVDAAKDQSYVLYMLDGDALGEVVFPVGEMTKSEVRAHAARLGLRTASKAESMDVCFITRGDRVDFVARRRDVPAARLVDSAGTTIGTHDTVAAFTVGQRRGLGVATGERRYVVDIDMETDATPTSAVVTVGTRDELLRDRIALEALTFVGDTPPDGTCVDVQTSAHGRVVGAVLRDGGVDLAELRPRVAPGQIVALYDGGHPHRLLGGGIAAAEPGCS